LKEEFSDISGAVQDKGTWRKRCNHELYKLFNEPDIKINGLSWAGHVIRMKNSGSIKKVFDARPEGTRKPGRPKLRWKDGVIQDIRTLEVKTWRNVNMNTEDWLKPLKARVHTGLSNH
jgi:hypothetical protein